MLIDEGLSAGDAAFLEKARLRVAKMMNRASVLVLASHDKELLRTFCNSAILLSHGQVVGTGTVDHILEQYAGKAGPVAHGAAA